MKKIVLFNLKYSENVGDGLLSECLESGLRRAFPQAEVVALDLSGRTRYGTSAPGRRRLLEVLQRLPAPLRRLVVRVRLAPTVSRLEAEWTRALDGADAAVFGGGHLFQDTDLNFPLKIAAAGRACRASGTPVAIHAVGVGGQMSPAARRLFASLSACEIRSVSVRDGASAAAWARHFAGLPPAAVFLDPALTAEQVYGAARAPAAGGGTVGVGVAHPVVLRYHATAGVAGTRPDAVRFYVDLARQLRDRGHGVALFTNGAAEDEEHLDAVMAAIGAADGIRRLPRPQTPSDLVAIVAATDAVVAHRLHANILAYALGRPSIGLAWDRKLADFFDLVGYPDRVATPDHDEDAAAMVRAAASAGVDRDGRAETVRRAGAAMAALAAALADGKPLRAAAGALWTVNGRFLAQRTTGVQRYAREIVGEIDRMVSRNETAALTFEIVTTPEAEDARRQGVPTRRSRKGSGHLWDQVVLPLVARGSVLSLCNTGPLAARDAVVCIHDVNILVAPESYGIAYRWVHRLLDPVVARRARRVLTVSEHSARMIVERGWCGRDKIVVAPNGHEHALAWEPARARPGLLDGVARPFVLLLGSAARHKNVAILLAEAAQLDALGIDVVAAGGGDGGLFAASETIEATNIRRLGYVSDDDLALLFERALCFAFPSLAEGFGLPVLEAMARGCAVVSSTSASLPEVGGDAVLYADPLDGRAWTAQIARLAGDDGLRRDLAARGRKRAKRFSWKDSAAIIVAVLAEVEMEKAAEKGGTRLGLSPAGEGAVQ